jgi:hypothetical protein
MLDPVSRTMLALHLAFNIPLHGLGSALPSQASCQSLPLVPQLVYGVSYFLQTC